MVTVSVRRSFCFSLFCALRFCYHDFSLGLFTHRCLWILLFICIAVPEFRCFRLSLFLSITVFVRCGLYLSLFLRVGDFESLFLCVTVSVFRGLLPVTLFCLLVFLCIVDFQSLFLSVVVFVTRAFRLSGTLSLAAFICRGFCMLLFFV